MPCRRVLVCGSNYGRIYFEALKRGRGVYEPAGLLARGSPRSVALAQSAGVPLFRSAGEIPAGIDAACVALGMGAEAVTLALLERGIPLLCEHPQRPAFLRRALRAARQRSTPFHLNGHFCYLEAPRAFIGEARRLSAVEPLLLFHGQATDRSLYGLIDIAAHALPDFSPGRFGAVSRQPPWVLLGGRLNAAAALVEIQWPFRRRLPDGSPHYLLDLRIALGFPSGILTLLSIAGPVIWNANLGRIEAGGKTLWSVLSRAAGCTDEELEESRIRANLIALDALVEEVATGRRPPEQSPGHILAVSRLWQRLATLAEAPSALRHRPRSASSN